MSVSLLTFATPDFQNSAEALVSSALNVGFSRATVVTPDEIRKTAFFKRNEHILRHKRGGGYWLWKPYIILEALGHVAQNDIVMYCDAGRSSYYCFSRYPKSLIHMVQQSDAGFLLGPVQPHLGPVRQWTKRDCLILMNADSEPYLSNGTLAGTWSLWRRTPRAVAFLREWLGYCEDSRCITDEPNSCGLDNYYDFKDHRHDQAILTLLAYTRNAPYLDFSTTWTHRIMAARPNSGLAHNFYKRPENADRLLSIGTPLVLVREFIRLKLA